MTRRRRRSKIGEAIFDIATALFFVACILGGQVVANLP